MYDASIDFSGRVLKDRPLISYPNFVENARISLHFFENSSSCTDMAGVLYW